MFLKPKIGSIGSVAWKQRRSVVVRPYRLNTPTSTEELTKKREDILEKFRMTDVDGNGRIDTEELRTLLESVEGGLACSLEHWLRKEEVDDILKRYDTDGSGDLSFEEFQNLVDDSILLEMPLEDYQIAFNSADANKSGGLDFDELMDFLEKIGSPRSKEQLAAVMNKYDKDQSGTIEFQEFLLMFRDQLLDLEEIVNYLKMPSSDTPETPLDEIDIKFGEVTTVESGPQIKQALELSKDSVCVLMVAFTFCRPCKAFSRTYEKFAAYYDKALFIKLYGNANSYTKDIAKNKLKIRSSPAFVVFSKGQMEESWTGKSSEKLETFLRKYLAPENTPEQLLYPAQQPVA